MYELFAYWIIPPILVLLALVAIKGNRWQTKVAGWIREKVNKEINWLLNQVTEQRDNLPDYLSTVVDSIDYTSLASTKLIKVKVELINLTVFTLDITRVNLSVWCNGMPLGAAIDDLNPKRQVAGQRQKWNLTYPITNTNFLSHFKEACLKCQRLNWQFHITWFLENAKYKRAFTKDEQVSFIEAPDLTQREIDAL